MISHAFSTVPTLLLQGDKDPVVSAKSAQDIMEKMTACKYKQIKIINSDRHGILNENISDTWAIIDAFMLERRNETNVK